MKNLIRGKLGLLVGAACATATMSLSAATIFDNTSTFENGYFTPTGQQEIGDQVYWSTTPSLANYRMIDTFNFQYWSFSSDNNWNVEARVKFYANDGTLFQSKFASPGSTLWDSGWFSLPRFNAYQVLNFSTSGDFPSIGVQAPQNTMTWTIQFRGADANDQYGLALFTQPTVGTDPSDYWQYVNNSWQLATNTLVGDMSFGASFAAHIPEPSTSTLSVLGGLGLLAWTRRMRNQK